MGEEREHVHIEKGIELDEISVDDQGRVVIDHPELAEAVRTLTRRNIAEAKVELMGIDVNIGPFCGIDLNRKKC